MVNLHVLNTMINNSGWSTLNGTVKKGSRSSCLATPIGCGILYYLLLIHYCVLMGKNQQNGPQKAASQTQESLGPRLRIIQTGAKVQNPEIENKAGAVPGSTVRLGHKHIKHLRDPQNTKAKKKDCGNSLYGGYPRGVGSYSHPGAM